MNCHFESPDGFVGVTYPDSVPRVRTPMTTCTHVGQLGARFEDFFLSWLPIRPEQLARKRPVHPNWIGTFVAAEAVMAVHPLAWEPHIPTYIAAPRLHRTFHRAIFDPLSGQSTAVAQQMAWDPKRKAPLVTRPRLRETTAFFYVPPSAVITSGTECIEMVDEQGAAPVLASETFTVPALIGQTFTVPALVEEDLC